MNKKERVLSALYNKKHDIVPWTMYKSYPPWGETERYFRNEGLTMIYQHFPICRASIDNVEVTEDNQFILNGDVGKRIIIRKFKTSIGEVSVKHKFIINDIPCPGDLIQFFGSEIDQEQLSWVTEYPFKCETDYEIIEYIYKNISYKLNNDEYLKTDKIIGNDGVIFAFMGKSPFQMLLYEIMGPENCYLEYYNNPKKFIKLYEVLYQKQKEKYIKAAESSAMIFSVPENLTSILTPPNIFKEYYIPFYNEMAEILHSRGKIYAVHMDGKLASLVEAIKETKIDVIEAFTPPPMGDITVSKAVKSWGDKVIWINFPGTMLATSDSQTIEEYTKKIIKSIPDDKNILIGCTETYPIERWDMAFNAILSAIKKYGNKK